MQPAMGQLVETHRLKFTKQGAGRMPRTQKICFLRPCCVVTTRDLRLLVYALQILRALYNPPLYNPDNAV